MSPASLLQRPRIEREGSTVRLSGDWTLQGMRAHMIWLRHTLRDVRRHGHAWDLSGVHRLDSFGALLLWRTWGGHEPETLVMPAALSPAFERIRGNAAFIHERFRTDWFDPLALLGTKGIHAGQELIAFLRMLGQVGMDGAALWMNPRRIPWREISATLYKAGATALPIAGLLGFLIGLVLAYLMVFQLRNFGADAFIVNILGIGVTREIGPMLVSVLVAGRSGSAFTAQIGTMRVTEEIDALAAMGVSRHLRLVLPKVIALALAMPLLVAWTSAAAIAGGMLVANSQLDIDPIYFMEAMQRVVPIENFYIGLLKGSLFGATIALIGSHFGLRVKPNTESLSLNTTRAVVASISAVIVIDALIAVAVRTIGMPGR